MFTDFVSRAYGPHVALIVVTIALCAYPHPPWPDESWARQYDFLDWRYQRYLQKAAEARPGAEYNQARKEWWRECELAEQVNARISAGRAPVYVSLIIRTALLALATAICYVVTDCLVACNGENLLLPDLSSHLLLICLSFVGAFLTILIARQDPEFAAGLFVLADGLALSFLLAERDAYGAFARAHEEAQASVEAWEAEVRRGTTGARLEAESYYAAHREQLQTAVPEPLWRASINAAIPEGTDPAKAWAAARKLIQKLLPLVTQAEEIERLKEEQAAAKAATPAGPDPQEVARAAFEEMKKDVIDNLRFGLTPAEIAEALETPTAAPAAPRVLTPDDFKTPRKE